MNLPILLALVLIAVACASPDGIGKLRAAAEEATAAGDMARATSLWNDVVALEPLQASNYYKRFRVYLRQSKFKEATSDLNKVLEIEPTHESALSQRAKLYLRLGKCLESSQDFATLKGVNPASKELHMANQASSCEIAARHANKQFQQGQYAGAAQHFTQAIQFTIVTTAQKEQCVDLLLKRAQCSYHTGDMHMAIADSGKVLKVAKENIDALTVRGNAYYALGELDTAKEHYRQALKYVCPRSCLFSLVPFPSLPPSSPPSLVLTPPPSTSTSTTAGMTQSISTARRAIASPRR